MLSTYNSKGVSNFISSLIYNSTKIILVFLILIQMFIYIKNTEMLFDKQFGLESNINYSLEHQKIEYISIFYENFFHEDITIIKNGMVQKEVKANEEIVIFVTKGDVIIIDALNNTTSGIVRFKGANNTNIPNKWPEKLDVSNGLYQLPPFR